MTVAIAGAVISITTAPTNARMASNDSMAEDRTAGQLADRQPVMEGGGHGRQEQQEREADRQQIAEPMDASEQVVETLAPRELKAMGGQRDQFPPLPAQDLNSAEGPPKSLLLQTIEAQGHEPFAPNRRLVDADGAKPEHS